MLSILVRSRCSQEKLASGLTNHCDLTDSITFAARFSRENSECVSKLRIIKQLTCISSCRDFFSCLAIDILQATAGTCDLVQHSPPASSHHSYELEARYMQKMQCITTIDVCVSRTAECRASTFASRSAPALMSSASFGASFSLAAMSSSKSTGSTPAAPVNSADQPY